MKIGVFEIICTKCGSKKVAITNVHNDYEAYIRIKCNKCGAKTEI